MRLWMVAKCAVGACYFAAFVFVSTLANSPPAWWPADAHRYAWRLFRFIALQPFYPGCGYYSWETQSGRGWGPARWHWREPKHPRWVANPGFMGCS